MPVFFNNSLLVTPAVSVLADDSQMINPHVPTEQIVAILGSSDGGQPNTPLEFLTARHARRVLKGGALLRGIEAAFDPRPDGQGPLKVIGVRTDPATQATVTLLDGSAGNSIVLTSANYGAHTNNVRVKVESGTTAGKLLTVNQGSETYTADNVNRGALSVVYTGAQATATVTVSNTQVVLAAPAGSTVATLELSEYPTVAELANRISGVSGFSATVVSGSAASPTLNALDAVSAQSCKTTPYTVRADLAACVEWFNAIIGGLVTAARASGATKVPANTTGWTYLAGATNGTVTSTEWTNAFTALREVKCQWVVPMSSDPTVHAMADAHAVYMSTVGRGERRALVGGASGLTVDQAVSAAMAIGGDRTGYCYPEVYRYQPDGTQILEPPYITAALVAGGFCGMAVGEPMTNKALKVSGVGRVLRVPADTDYLIRSGVLCVAKSRSDESWRVVQSISTWINDTKYNKVELSCGAALDYVVRTVRERLEDGIIGQKASPLTLARIESLADTVLSELSVPEPMGEGVLAGDTSNPPYRNIEATIDGDVATLAFECSPVVPLNYVLVTIHAVPYSSRNSNG